jgi:hypothetical protein
MKTTDRIVVVKHLEVLHGLVVDNKDVNEDLDSEHANKWYSL